eukprot:9479482-Lingulodinium_polyedra.AAC.1
MRLLRSTQRRMYQYVLRVYPTQHEEPADFQRRVSETQRSIRIKLGVHRWDAAALRLQYMWAGHIA